MSLANWENVKLRLKWQQYFHHEGWACSYPWWLQARAQGRTGWNHCYFVTYPSSISIPSESDHLSLSSDRPQLQELKDSSFWPFYSPLSTRWLAFKAHEEAHLTKSLEVCVFVLNSHRYYSSFFPPKKMRADLTLWCEGSSSPLRRRLEISMAWRALRFIDRCAF